MATKKTDTQNEMSMNDLLERLVDRIDAQAREIGRHEGAYEAIHEDNMRLRAEIANLKAPAQTPYTEISVPHGQIARVVQIVLQFGPEKIKAIKHVRELTHLGLKEAKDVVDALWPVLGLVP